MERIAAALAAYGSPVIPHMIKLAGERDFSPIKSNHDFFSIAKVDTPFVWHAKMVIELITDKNATVYLKRIVGMPYIEQAAFQALPEDGCGLHQRRTSERHQKFRY